MAYAEYDQDTLPKLVYSFQNTIEKPTRFLGGKAFTGEEYMNVNFLSKTDEQTKALSDFWENDINFGIDPFLIAAPYRGVDYDESSRNVLVRFVENFSPTKNDFPQWRISAKLKVLEYKEILGYLVDDPGNELVDDAGNDLFSESEFSTNSNKEITYG